MYPFVGLIESTRDWVPSAGEVAEVLELPLTALVEGYGRRRLLRRGLPIRTDTYVVGDDLIWGATARILADLIDRLAALGLTADPDHPANDSRKAQGMALPTSPSRSGR